MKKTDKSILATIAAASLLMLPVSGITDDVTDSINEGLKAYDEGEYQESVESLNYAVQLIMQKKSENLSAFLPGPLDGWKASDADTKSAGAAMFGGGITAQRDYRKNDSKVTVSLVTDSPMLQGLMMMFSNPMFATSDGGKMTRINRQKAIVKYRKNDNAGEIQIIVDKRILVTVKGSNVSLEDLQTYAEAIDYKKLEDS